MSEVQKVSMSPEWTDEERATLMAVLDSRIGELEQEEQGWRETIRWEAPCFRENAAKRAWVEELREMLRDMPTGFLEKNRHNFSEFITD